MPASPLITRYPTRAALAAAIALLAACSSASTGAGEQPAPVLWKFETVSWYKRYSLNSSVGPIIVGKTVLYGGTYGYQNTYASKLALVDPALSLKHGFHAVTSNRNAIDLFAGKWLRAPATT